MYDPNENQDVFGDGSGVSRSDVVTQLAPSMPRGGAMNLTVPQIPAQVMDMFRPSSMPVNPRSLSSGYGTPGSGVRANDYALSLGQVPRQRVREFDQRQSVDTNRQQGAVNADNERRSKLATAILESIFAPSIQAQSNVGAQQVAAQGRRDVAEIEGQAQRDVATMNRPSMFEQVMKVAPTIAGIIAQQQQGQVIPEGAMWRGPTGETVNNPRPQPMFQQLDDGTIITTGGMKATMPRADAGLGGVMAAGGNGSLPTPKTAGQKLTPAEAQQYVAAAGGDKAKARQMAQAAGFTF